MEYGVTCFTWIAVIAFTNGAFYDVFEPCCHEGVQWSSASYRCDNYPAPVVNISDNDQTSCLSIIEVCCIKQTQILACEGGKLAALDDQLCAVRDTEPGAEQFRECCHCCHLGMESQVSTPACQSPGLGEPCDSKYRECCLGEKSGNLSFTGVLVHTLAPSPTTQPPPTTKTARELTTEEEVDDPDDVITMATPSSEFTFASSTNESDDGSDDNDGDEMLTSNNATTDDSGGYVGNSENATQDTDDSDDQIGDDNETDVGDDKETDVGDDEKTDVGDDNETDVGDDNETDVGDDKETDVGDDNETDVGDDKETDVGDDNETDVGDDGGYGEDINECQLFLGQVCSHICVNTRIGFYCACPDGFRLDPSDNQTCEAEEIEQTPEVTEPTTPQPVITTLSGFASQDRPLTDSQFSCFDNNPCDQRCSELPDGGVRCRCFEGYRLLDDQRSCEDINECVEAGISPCSPGQNCLNTLGRYTCTTAQCPDGYLLDVDTGRCKADREQCANGYEYNPSTDQCEDINECGLGIDSCSVGERCENSPGSYFCRRERHCGTGYTLDQESQRCMDNDECQMGTHNCHGGYQCLNIRGSFRCVPISCEEGSRFDSKVGRCVVIECAAGLRPNQAGNCIDIDECKMLGESACRRHQRCINTRGSFYCRNFFNCPPGYEPTETKGCQDIDECEVGTHRCGVEQECVNRQGTYFCQCPRGMRHDNTGRCVDVDECSYGAAICPSNSQCVNTMGSFKCDCVDGLVSDGHDSCKDVDECAEQTGICQQSCVNVVGTFFCSCNRGYQLKDDKRSCEDINECTQFRGRRGRSGVCGGRCLNVPGSYRCQCPDGWRLKPDGRSCEDVNECREGLARCPHPDSLCINTRGGYKCPVVRCPQGYLKTNSSSQKNSIKCRRVSVNCPECKRGLLSRTYNFISFASNVRVPAPLFSMTGSRLVGKFYSWDLDLLTAHPLRAGVPAADSAFFSLEKRRDFARVTLLRQIPGPQDLVLKMTMNVTSHYKGFEGMAESRIYLYITDADEDYLN